MRYMSVCSGIEAASLAWEYLDWEPVAFADVEPFPCAVLKSHWPNVPNLGDMTKISVQENGDIHYGNGSVLKNDGKPIDILIGGTPCFVAGTMVLTNKGYVPIETIQVGDKVVSHDGTVNPVLAVGSKIAENVGKLKILGRPEFSCTPGHPFYSIQMKKDFRRHASTYNQMIPADEYAFTAAEKTVGRHVGRLPIDLNGKYPSPEFPFAYGLSNEEIMELAGWYVGDGYIRRFKGKNKKTLVLALVSEKKINLFTSHFPRRFYSIQKDGKLLISCTALCNWLSEQFGELAENKRIPYWVYCTDLKRRFLEGYEAADGCNDGNTIQASSVSKALAYGYADLGENTSICFHKVKPQRMLEGRVINQKDYWLVRRYDVKTPRTQIIGDRYATICRKWEDGPAGIVYNITVAAAHSYIVEGIAVHNCQSFSAAGNREGLKGVSGLALDYVRLLYELAAYRGLRYAVHENVPNMLSCGTPKGSDYATFLSALTGWDVDTPRNGWGSAGVVPPASEGNFGAAYRILDVRYCRVDGFPQAIPQRRRRVFTLLCLGDWKRAAEILFEQQSLLGNHPPQRSPRQGVSSSPCGGSCGDDRADGEAGGVDGDDAEGRCQELEGHAAGGGYDDVPRCDGESKRGGNGRPPVAFEPGIARREGDPNRFVDGVSPTLRAVMGDNLPAVAQETPVQIGFRESGFGGYVESEEGAAQKASRGSAGGGSETFVASDMKT